MRPIRGRRRIVHKYRTVVGACLMLFGDQAHAEALDCGLLIRLVDAASARFSSLELEKKADGAAARNDLGATTCVVVHENGDGYFCGWMNMSVDSVERLYGSLQAWVPRCMTPIETSTYMNDKYANKIRYVVRRTPAEEVAVVVGERRTNGKLLLEFSVRVN